MKNDTEYFDPGPPGYCWLTGYRIRWNDAETTEQRQRRQYADAKRKREKKAKEKQLETLQSHLK